MFQVDFLRENITGFSEREKINFPRKSGFPEREKMEFLREKMDFPREKKRISQEKSSGLGPKLFSPKAYASS